MFPSILSLFPELDDVRGLPQLSPEQAEATLAVKVLATRPDALPSKLDASFAGEAACLLRVRAGRSADHGIITLGHVAADVARRHPDAGLSLFAAGDRPMDVPGLLMDQAQWEYIHVPGPFGVEAAPRLMVSAIAAVLDLTVTAAPLAFCDDSDGRWAPVDVHGDDLHVRGTVAVTRDGDIRLEPQHAEATADRPSAPASWLVASSTATVLTHLRLPRSAVYFALIGVVARSQP